MQREFGLAVHELFHLPPFKDAKLVAGHNGLDRVVTSVNVMEVPDILEWVREGDLLLTTFYPIRNDIDSQQQLIPHLYDRGLAALAYKPRRYIETIPAYMVESANALALPILELPQNVSFSDLTNAVLTKIVNRQADYLKRSLHAHRHFATLVLSGGSLQDLADGLSHLVENTVLVRDEHLLRSAFTCAGWDPADFSSLSQAKPIPWQASASVPTNHVLADVLENTSHTFTVDRIRVRDRELNRVSTPITVSGKRYGEILVWETGRGLTVTDFISMEQVNVLAALDILHQRALRQVEQRYRNEFIDRLLSSPETDHTELVDRARFFGRDLSGPWVVFFFGIDYALMPPSPTPDPHPGIQELQELKDRLIHSLERACQHLELAALPGSQSKGVVLLVPDAKGTPPQGARERSLTLAADLRRQLLLPPGVVLTIGIGTRQRGLAGLQRSYREARQALEIGRRVLGGEGGTIHFDQLGVYQLIQHLPGGEEVETFLENTVLPLVRHDHARHTELLRTLQTYYDCNGNASEVAKRLYTHYNT
ncbi:MAG TPA: hypothetical protein GX513_06685, partial [Firmicutes bacterium]|nr:hypothetical protein [Bacillota bacterium]